MDWSDIFPLISRWLHVIAAIVLVGGTIFMRFAIVPVQKNGAIDESAFDAIRSAWTKLVMLSILFLLASGLYNAALKAIGYQLDGIYLGLLTTKIVLALVVFFLVSVLSGRSDSAQKYRAAGTKYYNVTVVVMLLLVCIAGYMKMSPQEIKIRDESSTPEQTVESQTASGPEAANPRKLS